METTAPLMPILRLAYVTQFLIALIVVFLLWPQVGGQSHFDILPWYTKLSLGAGASFAIVQATAAAVSQERAWNTRTVKWTAILIAFLIGCGMASNYAHQYLEPDDNGDDSVTSPVVLVLPKI